MDSMSGRSSNDQLGDQSLGSTNGRYSVQIHGDPLDPLLSHHRAFSYISSHLTSSSMANLPQPQQTMQMPGLPVNNTSDGNGALSLSLFGDLAKVVGLLGNNNNNNNNGGYLGSTLGLNPQIEQQLRALGLHPSQYPSAGVSQTQSSSRGGDSGEDMSSKYSFSTRGQGGSSVSVQSGGRNKKPNRIVVVPCRARGMSMEHNFQTAYFEIPENINHGDGLICSFPECRNRGVKFLYCAYCKGPVAKRNFRNRHTHDNEAEKERNEKQQPAQTKKPPLNTATQRSSSVNTKNPHQVSEGTGSNTGSGSSSGVLAVAPKYYHQKDGKKRSGGNISDDASKKKLARMDNERKDAWAILLAERPATDQSDAMSAWLMKVMAVSDLKKPTAQAIALSMEQRSSGSSNEDSNESSPTDESAPTESSSNGAVKGVVKKIPSSKPTSSNEDSSPTNGSSNESSNDSSSDNQDDMDIKEIWIRD